MVNTSFVKTWYGKEIPKSFEKTVAWGVNSMEIIRYLTSDLGYQHKDKIKLAVDNTAFLPYFDSKQATIYYPAVIFTEQFYDSFEVPVDKRLETFVAIYNGFQVHEALHVLSPIDEFDSFAKDNDIIEIEKPILFKCLNVVEDIYIEQYARDNYANVMPFLDITNDVLFTQKSLEQQKEQLDEPTIENIIGYLIYYKLPRYRNDIEFTSGQFVDFQPLLEQALTEHNKNKRMQIALGIYNLLEKNYNDAFENQKDQNKLERNMRNTIDEFVESLKEIAEELDKLIASDVQLANELRQVSKKIEENETENKIVNIRQNNDGNYNYKTVNSLSPSNLRNSSVNWNNFAQTLLYMRSEKHTPYIPMTEGNTLLEDELYRLYSDQKVFSTQTHNKRDFGVPQVICLIDASGSMHSIINQVCSEVYGFFTTLKVNNIPVSAYAHTTSAYANSPTIYGIAGYKMAVPGNVDNTYKVAFQKAASIDGYGNADGEAIEFVAKLFDKKRVGTKTLFIFSDGAPTECSYNMSASDYLVSTIKKLRERGINVYSISLVDDVVKRNDEYYGKQYNVDASGNKLGNELKKLTTMI